MKRRKNISKFVALILIFAITFVNAFSVSASKSNYVAYVYVENDTYNLNIFYDDSLNKVVRYETEDEGDFLSKLKSYNGNLEFSGETFNDKKRSLKERLEIAKEDRTIYISGYMEQLMEKYKELKLHKPYNETIDGTMLDVHQKRNMVKNIMAENPDFLEQEDYLLVGENAVEMFSDIVSLSKAALYYNAQDKKMPFEVYNGSLKLIYSEGITYKVKNRGNRIELVKKFNKTEITVDYAIFNKKKGSLEYHGKKFEKVKKVTFSKRNHGLVFIKNNKKAYKVSQKGKIKAIRGGQWTQIVRDKNKLGLRITDDDCRVAEI